MLRPKTEPKKAKNLSKENSNKYEFSAQFLAAEDTKRKAVIFSLFLFDLRLNLRPRMHRRPMVAGWKSRSYAGSFIW
jgi:hypothetical protein